MCLELFVYFFQANPFTCRMTGIFFALKNTNLRLFGVNALIVVFKKSLFKGSVFYSKALYTVLSASAVLSGAVFGDQVSPISDATILSAATAQCDHMDYVKAQLPVALLNAVVAFVGFLAGGLTNNIWVGWLATLVGFVVLIVVSYFLQKKKGQLLPKLTLGSFEEEKDVASTDSHAE